MLTPHYIFKVIFAVFRPFSGGGVGERCQNLAFARNYDEAKAQ